MADISKVEKCGRPHAMTPTLMQNTIVWSESLQREAVPMEHFVFQGFPAMAAVAGYAQLPWENELGCPPRGVSDIEVKSLTGNAMHLAVIGAVCLFALCSYERHSGAGPMRFRHMTSLLDLGEVGE